MLAAERIGCTITRGKVGTTAIRCLEYIHEFLQEHGFAPSVLDPFAGYCTTGAVALTHGRSFLGIEGSAKYCGYAKERLELLGGPAGTFERRKETI